MSILNDLFEENLKLFKTTERVQLNKKVDGGYQRPLNNDFLLSFKNG